MQRWFFLEDPSNGAIRSGKGDTSISSESLHSLEYPPKQWLFRTRVPEIGKEETVCIIGDIPELGSWQPERCIALQREDDCDIWSAFVDVPDKKKFEYRYCVCIIIDSGLQVIVRSWESHINPRKVDALAKSPTFNEEPQEFGNYDDQEQIERGWLNKETVVQLKLFNNPLTLFRPKYQNREIFIKVTPVNLARHHTNMPKTMSEALEESLSADTQDSAENPKHAITEVASLNAEDPRFKKQDQFGQELKKDDMLIFQSALLFPTNIAFLIDLYIYSSRSGEGEPPYHAGFSYLLPTALHSSEGNVVLPVTSTKHRPLGQLQIAYLVIGPLPNFKCDMRISYAKHWKKTRAGLDVGHRGSGSSFKNKVQNCAEVRENTIASLKNAINHGADFVEFDVQLSRDLVPIIYHDFHVCMAMKKKKELNETDMLEIPLKDLTLEQLRLLKVSDFLHIFFHFESFY